MDNDIYLSEVRKALEDELMLKRLYVFARKKSQKFQDSALGAVFSPEDLVHEAIQVTLDKRRRWDYEKCPEIFVHLAGCIKSIVSNSYVKSEFSLRSDSEVDLDSFAGKVPSPEERLNSQQKRKDLLNFIKETSPSLLPIATAIINNDTVDRKELSEYLDVDVSMIDNSKKKLKRLSSKFALKDNDVMND